MQALHKNGSFIESTKTNSARSASEFFFEKHAIYKLILSICAHIRAIHDLNLCARAGIATLICFRATKFRPSDDFPLGSTLKGCSNPKALVLL